MNRSAYLFQAALIASWWILISVDERIYRIFAFSAISETAFFSLLLPDVVLIGGLSLLRAFVPWRDLGVLVLGAFAYATLFCLNASITGGDGLVPTATMVFGLLFNVLLVYPGGFFRPTRSRSWVVNAGKTGLQIIAFWSLFLIALPLAILWSTDALPVTLAAGIWLWIGVVVLVAASILGLSSALVMVRHGQGTPLPLDGTNALVTTGPYARVRNPMAVAGLGQIVGIAILVGSLAILVYGLVGALAWHFMVRPIEERDMAQRFGPAYDRYRQDTPCWIPWRSSCGRCDRS